MSEQNKKDRKMKIKISHKDIPIGHQNHISGSGPHKDKRTKRNRTRSNQKKNDIEERL